MGLQVESTYPVKKGRLAKDKDQNYMLLNADGQAFSTNTTILLIWELCCGQSSIKELTQKVKENTKRQSGEPVERTCQIIEKLAKAKLVELKKVES